MASTSKQAGRLAFAVALAALASGCARAMPYAIVPIEPTPTKAPVSRVPAPGGESIAAVQPNAR